MSLEDTSQGATEYKLPHRNRFCNKNGRQKRLIGEEIPLEELPEFFSVSKLPRKIKRRLRRCGTKRLSRHSAPAAANCYPHIEKGMADHTKTTSMKPSHLCLFRRMVKNPEY